MKTVSVIDYGLCNIFSVVQAIEKAGAKAEIIQTPEQVIKSDRLLLPGVGAFKKGMDGLKSFDLVEPIKSYAKSGRPFLGICLGMQMLMDRSEEFGDHEGLGLISGRVVSIPSIGVNGEKHKVPFVNWAALENNYHTDWNNTLLKGLNKPQAYFVHSYMCQPNNTQHIYAQYDYSGVKISAVIGTNNVCGMQFHPERSANDGLKIIENFISWAP